MSYDDDDELEGTLPGGVHAGPLPDRTPVEVERQVCGISTRSPLDELCAMLDAADWLYARAKTIQQLAKQKAIAWIDKNGEFDIGPQHYRVAYACTVRCIALKPCGHRLLDCLHGDFDGFLDVLAAQPFKSGAARRILDEPIYREFFKVQQTSRLTNGLPQRVLRRCGPEFRR